MKKIFMSIFCLFVLPFVVSAEEKTFGDIKYIIEEKDAKDYVCEEIKEHDLQIMLYADLELLIEDKTENKTYLVDITNPGVCKEHNTIPLTFDIKHIDWGENNQIFEYTYENSLNIVFTNVEGSDNFVAFLIATGQYDPNITYYTHGYNGMVRVTSPSTPEELAEVQTKIDNSEYYIIAEPKTKTLLGSIDPSNLVAPKEKTGLTEDLVFEKKGLLGTFDFNNKKYYVFYDENTGQYLAAFDEIGNYQTFGKDKLLLNNLSHSPKGEYIILLKEEDGKQVAEILDNSYNIVLTKEVADYIIHFFGENDNVNYIVKNNLNTMEIKIMSITKTKIETEKVPNTYDGITTSIVIGIMALLGLVVTTILYRKKVC